MFNFQNSRLFNCPPQVTPKWQGNMNSTPPPIFYFLGAEKMRRGVNGKSSSLRNASVLYLFGSANWSFAWEIFLRSAVQRRAAQSSSVLNERPFESFVENRPFWKAEGAGSSGNQPFESADYPSPKRKSSPDTVNPTGSGTRKSKKSKKFKKLYDQCGHMNGARK